MLMSLILKILVAGIVVLFISFIIQFKKRQKHPPGPFGFPFVGQLPFMFAQILFQKILPRMSLFKYFKQMKERYGDIWSLDFGGHRIIVLASMDMINEAFIENNKLFSGRTPHESFKIISEDRGIIFTEGELWHDNRQLAIKALRDLGMGKQCLEDKVCHEADILIENIELKLGKPTMSPAVFVKAVSNVISQLTFNERNEYDDPELDYFIQHFNNVAHSHAAHDILELVSKIIPTKYARRIFPPVENFINDNVQCMRYIGNKCRSRKDIEGEYSKPGCVFDYFWRYRYQDNPEIDEHERFLNISHTMLDLFIAGSETSTTILAYTFLILGQDQDLQEELRTEIEQLVDDHRLIKMDNRKDCPKLHSFLDEVQRYFHLIPLIQNKVLKTCMFKGYKIEPSDGVYGDLATASRDPNLFKNPNDFDPYRFMDESKTKYIPNKVLIPFGIGKRACLGESIAMMEIFLFLSKILHRLKIHLSNKTKNNISEILEGNYGIVHGPLNHEFIFELAHSN